MATASLVVYGVVGLFLFGTILGVLAIILDYTAMDNISRKPREYGGQRQSIAGMVLGIVFFPEL
jgi:ABC-type phosphate transport system permease subunit